MLFQATGNPTPEIIWFKGQSPIKESSRVGVVNSNTELRISNLRESDLDEYTCLARNGVDQDTKTTKVVLAGITFFANYLQQQRLYIAGDPQWSVVHFQG